MPIELWGTQGTILLSMLLSKCMDEFLRSLGIVGHEDAGYIWFYFSLTSKPVKAVQALDVRMPIYCSGLDEASKLR